MLHSVDELLGFTIHAADGDIGRVHDLYFDDQGWTIRYLVVDTRHWLILLSPVSVRRVDWARREIVVALSREQIRRSPNVDTDQPVGRGRIALFRECYTLPYSWALGGFLWASAPSARPAREVPRRPGDPHLRSTRLLRGYGVKAMNGDVGHVEGFLVDDSSWALRHVVVNTRHWRPGHRVIIPSEWIAWVSWIELAMHVDLRVEHIMNAPDYDPSQSLTSADETRLSAYYGRADPRRHNLHIAR